MNIKNVHQIFANYIDRFAELNDTKNEETFKWLVAVQFRSKMKEALKASDDKFAGALQKIKDEKIVETIIDSSMQPFAGLIELAKNEPSVVKAMLKELFADDNGDLGKREAKIAAFFERCAPLEERYFPEKFRYKQTANSVAGYLFLYDPDQYYMYKAKQAKKFADCVEFNGDWGTGKQIKLKEYYRMCDELVKEIKKCDELRATDESRFERYEKGTIHQDENKHILAYDIIYCTSTYQLYNGLTFKSVSMKEKNLYQERQKKAQALQEEYNQKEESYAQIRQAVKHYETILVPGARVSNRKYGIGKVASDQNDIIEVQFDSEKNLIKFDFIKTIAEQYLKFDDSLDDETAQQYKELLKKQNTIYDSLVRLQKEMEEYRDILE